MTLADYIAKQVLAQLTSVATVSPQLQDTQCCHTLAARRDIDFIFNEKDFKQELQDVDYFVEGLIRKDGVALMTALRQEYPSRPKLREMNLQLELPLHNALLHPGNTPQSYEELKVCALSLLFTSSTLLQ
jgi:hypothetical protein